MVTCRFPKKCKNRNMNKHTSNVLRCLGCTTEVRESGFCGDVSVTAAATSCAGVTGVDATGASSNADVLVGWKDGNG